MGDPSDPVKNCLLQVCCGATEAQALYAKLLVEKGICKDDVARAVAADLFEQFELAPKGSLTAFKAEIARVAKA
jgi:hypothetical protein